MRILILTQYFWPESFRINELVSSLARAGCDVTILTGQPNYPDGVVMPGYSAIGIGRQEHKHGYSIYRVPIMPRGCASACRLAANYLFFIFSASVFGVWLLRGKAFDVIFVYAPSPILQAIPGIWLARLKRAKLSIWVQDLWPQSLAVTGFVTNKRLLGLVEKLVRWIYRRSDLLLVQSKAFVDPVAQIANGTPVLYFPNPGESGFLETSVAPALKLPEGFNVVFAGNLGTAQALETVLDAAQLLSQYSNLRFVIIGSGSRGVWLKQEAARRRLANVSFPGRYPSDAMPGILSQASALLVSLVSSPAMSQTVPTKIQAYLAVGRPIIAALDGEGAHVVVDAGAGIACPPQDAGALASAVLHLSTMSERERQEMGNAGRRFYRDHFDPDMLAQSLLMHLRHLSRTEQNR